MNKYLPEDDIDYVIVYCTSCGVNIKPIDRDKTGICPKCKLKNKDEAHNGSVINNRKIARQHLQVFMDTEKSSEYL